MGRPYRYRRTVLADNSTVTIHAMDDSDPHRNPTVTPQVTPFLPATDDEEDCLPHDPARDADQSFAFRISTNHTISLSEKERSRHLYLIGKTGSGKSNALEYFAIRDIHAHKTLILIDPHGDTARRVVDTIPSSRTRQTAYLDLADTAYAVGFNPLANIPLKRAALAASNITQALKDIFADMWGPRLEHFLFNGLVPLIEHGATLEDLPPLYYNTQHRKRFTQKITDPQANRFWHEEYPSYNDRYREDAQGPILNKIGQVLASPALRRILLQTHPKFTLSLENQIIIVNLNKGGVGAVPANLLGSLIISAVQNIVMTRSETEYRPTVSLIADEFQSFSSLAIASMLSETRKYGLQITIANQYISQLSDEVRDAVLGNVGTLVSFRVSAHDANILSPELGDIQDLPNQLPFHAVMKKDLDAFHIKTLPPLQTHGTYAKIIASSRRHFARKL